MEVNEGRAAVIFRALADPTRLRIMEILYKRSGITVQDLCTNFKVSRFAVMKHLNVLESAGLIRRERQGNAKQLYLDVLPLKQIYGSWIERFF